MYMRQEIRINSRINLGKYGRGVDPCAKIGRPAHGSMSQGGVMVIASSAVISASAPTPSPTVQSDTR